MFLPQPSTSCSISAVLVDLFLGYGLVVLVLRVNIFARFLNHFVTGFDLLFAQYQK